MKIIDLLNKIANGEQPPIKIKYGSRIFKLDYIGYKQASYLCDGKCLLEGWNTTMCLTDEVEIIEEDKKIEKIDLGILNTQSEKNREFKRAINELIDEVNKLKVSK